MTHGTLRESLAMCFPDKSSILHAHYAEIIELLEQDARMPIKEIAQRLKIPITTAYGRYQTIKERLEMQIMFSPNLEAIPRHWFICPKCRSPNTTPTSRYNPVTGKTKITGLVCHVCSYQARRGELSAKLLKELEV